MPKKIDLDLPLPHPDHHHWPHYYLGLHKVIIIIIISTNCIIKKISITLPKKKSMLEGNICNIFKKLLFKF